MYTIMLTGLGLTFLHGNTEFWGEKTYAWPSWVLREIYFVS